MLRLIAELLAFPLYPPKPKPRRGDETSRGFGASHEGRSLQKGPSTNTIIHFWQPHVRAVVSPWPTSLVRITTVAALVGALVERDAGGSARHVSGRRHDPRRDARACEYAHHEDDHAYSRLRRPACPFGIERRSHFVGSGTRASVEGARPSRASTPPGRSNRPPLTLAPEMKQDSGSDRPTRAGTRKTGCAARRSVGEIGRQHISRLLSAHNRA